MSKKPASSKNPAPAQRIRRLNFRALILLVGLLVAVVGGGAALLWFQNQKGRHTLLAEARSRFEKKQTSLGLEYLDRYLELNPADVDALELKGKTLAELAQTDAQLNEAANVLTTVIGHDKNRWEARRLLVKAYLRIRDRARSAEAHAKALVDHDGNDADAHRLLAHALVQISFTDKDLAVVDAAFESHYNFDKQKKQMEDVEGARRFAALYYELKLPDKAQQVLDDLVTQTAPDPKAHVAALLARSEYFRMIRPPDRAKAAADVDLAFKEDPKNFDVLLAAADIALAGDKPDPATARGYLKEIDAEHHDDLRVKFLEARIDLAEHHPEEAIRTWREGLIRTGGNNADLTFKLAYVLLQLGRVREAGPLVEQYRRLSGGEEPVPSARLLQGLLDLGTARPEDADKAIKKLEPIRYKIDKPLEPDYLIALGQAYEIRHRTGAEPDEPKALAAYEEAAKLPGVSNVPWLAIAKIQAKSNPSEAVSTLTRARALNPGDPMLLTLLARMLWLKEIRKPEKDRAWDEIGRVIEDAKKAAPGAPELVLVEAEFLIARNNPDDAIGLLDTATRHHPTSGDLWLALANTLSRAGKLDDAIAATEQAVAKVGPQAGFYILRSRFWTDKAEGNKAKEALVDGLSRVPKEQRPTLWKSLGDLYQARTDPISAKAAYREWAKLEPDNPDPRQALFDLTLASGDDDAIAKAIAEVREVSGSKAYYWKRDQIEDLLRIRKGEKPDKARDDARLDEAEKLALEIEIEQPSLGFELEGRVKELKKEIDPAIAAYKKSLQTGGGLLVLNRLAGLLDREKRGDELDQLRKNLAAFPGLNQPGVSAPATESRADRLCALALNGDPGGLNAGVWQNEVFKALGNPKTAEAELELLIRNQPTEPGPLLRLLMLQVCEHERAKAAATIERIRTNVKVDKLDLLLAVCYRVTGDIPRSLESYQRALKQWPDEVPVLISAITFFEQANLRDDAEKALRSILRRDPANGGAIRTLAKSLAGHLGNSAAWDEALKLIGPDPKPNDSGDDTLTRADVYAMGPSSKDREQALAILNRMISESPNLPIIYHRAARLLFAANRLPEAREYAAKAAAGDRANPEAILDYAGVLVALKDLDAAQFQLDRLAAIDPTGLPVADLKAKILVAQGKNTEATKVLEDAFNNRAETPEALSVGEKMVRKFVQMKQPEAALRVARVLDEKAGPKGSCLLAESLVPLGKLDDAAALLEKAAKAGDPASAGVTALTFATTGKADPRWLPLADRFVTAALESQPKSVELLQKQAVIRHFQHMFKEEVDLYDKINKLDPPSFEFLNNMAWTLSEDLNSPDLGLKWADEAIKKCGDLAHIRDTRGVILTRLGNLDAAIKDLQIAVRDLPGGSTYYHLARALIKAKRPDEARKWQDLARKSGLTRSQLQPSELTDWDIVMGN